MLRDKAEAGLEGKLCRALYPKHMPRSWSDFFPQRNKKPWKDFKERCNLLRTVSDTFLLK